jgi:hypothetical protein
MHAVSTLAPLPGYLAPFDNLLFAAWPMLAACITLFLLCDSDTLFSPDDAGQGLSRIQTEISMPLPLP